MESQSSPEIPREQIIYGEIIYWITILACIICMIGPVVSVAAPDNNVLNPYMLFNAIFEGKSAEEVWTEVGGGFPGGHFYLKHPTYGDGLTQLGLALGCGCAFWGLLAAAAVYAGKKYYVYVILALWVATLVFLSMSGLVSGSH
jgi:hypothetical protein